MSSSIGIARLQAVSLQAATHTDRTTIVGARNLSRAPVAAQPAGSRSGVTAPIVTRRTACALLASL